MESLADHEFAEALASVDTDGVSALEAAEMLAEIAMRLQHKPKSSDQLKHSVALYERAIERCPESEALQRARLRARMATALCAIPEPGPESLLRARAELEAASPELARLGSAEETAEAELNLGLVLQSLAGFQRANVVEAIVAYQRAIRVFSRERYPTEYAILHNNLAAAYLSIPVSDERGKMREALAVQSFSEALKVITLLDNPTEYAMLQNNLGNALQYAASGHPIENNLRALEAYDQALLVRNPRDTPLEYANTLSNKANCLRNLPDDPDQPSAGNRKRLVRCRELYREALQLFERFGAVDKSSVVGEVLAEVESELGTASSPAYGDFAEPRV